MPAIEIVSADPYDGQQNLTIDSKITIIFDSEIDPFTVQNGVSIYTPTPGLWTGPALSVLDTKYTDVLDISEEYTYFPFNWTLEDNGGITNSKLIITPLVTLLPDKDYYLAVYPGDDSSRYISKLTTSPIVYTLDGLSTSDQTAEIVSQYKGASSGTINLTVTDVTGLIVEFTATDADLVSTVHAVDFTDGPQELNLEYLTLTLSDIDIDDTAVVWTILDSLDIDVFAAEGTSTVLKNKFTTTHIEQGNIPSSTKITSIPKDSSSLQATLKLVSSIPEDMSIGNVKVNPVTLRFNQAVTEVTPIESAITIKRKDMDSGVIRHIGYYYKINGDTIKLYMTSLI